MQVLFVAAWSAVFIVGVLVAAMALMFKARIRLEQRGVMRRAALRRRDCWHGSSVPVEVLDRFGDPEVVARLCLDCDAQLHADYDPERAFLMSIL